mmetsp:Transcript_18285/g.52048  ORF Transcript_18285/g.52048 Transcript_18285/m.52048 type:complete len:395 (-) Transcript_18285:140-1324(-)
MTIINMVNAMYSQQHESDDRLDAARALLGVSPNSVVDGAGSLILFGARDSIKVPDASSSVDESSGAPTSSEAGDAPARRQRSDSAGLEALAFLATKEQASMKVTDAAAALWEESSSELQNGRSLVASAVSSSSSSSDDETMPPPPPRRAITRRRSVSNPEGMEKWAPRDHNRLRFVLPESILEEELAEASAAMKAKQEREEDGDDEDEDEDEELESKEETDEDEANLSQDELLRRARSRLLEDLSEVNLNGEKGILTLPHALAKYKEVYNQNGRIGIYTPAERAAIINRFHGKRSRRMWKKKIRYNCRKSLADRRMRVKGRFVKRSTEQQAKLAVSSVPSTIPEDEKFVSPESSEVEENADDKDAEMPDINDPDAGFCPTEEQPFRRTRRHTIT